jgi:hypothetical protein
MAPYKTTSPQQCQKALATCDYELGDGVIQKRGEPTFGDFMCDRVCKVCMETSPALKSLMRKRRNEYERNVHKAIKWWREDYKEALRHSFEPWDL